MDWKAPANQEQAGRQLAGEYKLRTTAELTSCSTCHPLMDAMSDHEHDKQLRILQGPLAAKPALDEGHDHEDDEIVDDTVRGAPAGTFRGPRKAAGQEREAVLAHAGRAFGRPAFRGIAASGISAARFGVGRCGGPPGLPEN